MNALTPRNRSIHHHAAPASLSPEGRARYASMLDELLGEVESVRDRRRRRRRAAGATAIALCAVAAVLFGVNRLPGDAGNTTRRAEATSPPAVEPASGFASPSEENRRDTDRSPATDREDRAPADSGTSLVTRVSSDGASRIIRIGNEDLRRSNSVHPTFVQPTDDAELLRSLGEAGYPAGLIRTRGETRVTADLPSPGRREPSVGSPESSRNATEPIHPLFHLLGRTAAARSTEAPADGASRRAPIGA